LDTTPPKEACDRSLVLLDRGDEVFVQAEPEGIRFLLVSGKPLEEPVARYGPIVMNTQEQLRAAFNELQEGTFIENEKRRWWKDRVADFARLLLYSPRSYKT
jgi:redox-sensitive bicupin YhaK (pirin superfamily)